MKQIVSETMTMFQSDFERDLEILKGYEGKFIWQIAPTHTHLHLCGSRYLDEVLENEATLYAYCQNITWAGVCIEGSTSDDKFYVYDDETGEFFESSKDSVRKKWETCKTAALNRWTVRNCKELPTDFKMRISFNCEKTRIYFIEQVRYAIQHNDNSLLDCVRRFRNYTKRGPLHRIVIGRDYSYRSFTFYEDYGNQRYGIYGGIIFHGYPNEGYRENYSVQLNPSFGWSIHT